MNEDALRHRHLAQVAFGTGEDMTGFRHHRRDQRPDDDARGKGGQILPDGYSKEVAVYPAESGDRDQYAEGDPELSDAGSVIALPDVVHPKEQPHPPVSEAA